MPSWTHHRLALLFLLTFIGSVAAQPRSPVDLWIKESPWTPYGTNKFAFAHGKFYAASVDGGLYISTNGRIWNRNVEAPDYWRQPLLLREANGDVLTSFNNGDVAWIRGDGSFELFPGAVARWLNDLVYAQGIYVGVQFSPTALGTILTSTDGKVWTERTGVLNVNASVAFGNNRFVAVGNGIAVSDDGVSWEPRDSGQTNALQFVRFGAGRFVAVGFNGAIVSSTDGDSWTAHSSGVTNRFRTVHYGGGLFVAGSGAFIATSPDGVAWTSHRLPSNFVTELIYANGMFVGADQVSAYTAASTNGLDWQRTERGGPVGRGVAQWKGKFIVGNPYGIETSVDRRGWTNRITVGASQFAHNDSMIIGALNVPGFGNSAAYSTNGESWSRLTGVSIGTLAHGDDGFVAFGLGVGGSVVRSTDGRTWDTATTSASIHSMRCMTWGNGIYVAGGANGTLQRSVDGRQWQLIDTAVTNDITGLSHANGLFIATGAAGLILTSADAINWTRRETPTTCDLSRAAFGHGWWVIVGNKTSAYGVRNESVVLVSTNAATWEVSARPEQPLFDVIVTSDGFFAVGDGTFRSGYFGPASFMEIKAGSQIELQVRGQIGKPYRLEATETIAPMQWQEAATGWQTNEVQTLITLPSASSRFYRLVEQ